LCRYSVLCPGGGFLCVDRERCALARAPAEPLATAPEDVRRRQAASQPASWPGAWWSAGSAGSGRAVRVGTLPPRTSRAPLRPSRDGACARACRVGALPLCPAKALRGRFAAFCAPRCSGWERSHPDRTQQGRADRRVALPSTRRADGRSFLEDGSARAGAGRGVGGTLDRRAGI